MKAPVISRNRRLASSDALLYLVYAALTGCVTSGETDTARNSPVHVSVVATTTEVGWRFDSSSGLIVKIGDFDGTNDTFTWPIDALEDEERIQKFETCLEEMKTNLREARSTGKAEPHAMHTAVLACITSSGMPAYTTSAGQNATEYEVELQADRPHQDFRQDVGFRTASKEAPLVAHSRIRTEAAPPEVASDVNACAREASARGVYSTDQIGTWGDTGGMTGGMIGGMTAGMMGGSSRVSIEPLIERFDSCLRGRGYVVEPTKA